MPKVLCTSPNASEEIDGHKFEKHANGMLSENMSDEAAERFARIPGYEVVGGGADGATKAKAEADAKAADEAAKAALMVRADAVGFKPKSTWGVERLTAEVEKAETDAKAAAAEAEAKK